MTNTIWLVLIFTTFTGMLMGYDLCVIAVVEDPIRQSLLLSVSEIALMVSIISAGAVIGSLIGGPVADRFGRRISIALSDISIMIGALGMGLSETYGVLMAGRVLIGVGVGIGFAVVSNYISEISPPSKRGSLVLCLEISQCVGCLIAYFSAYMYGVAGQKWRHLLIAASVAALVQMFGLYFLPESPRWYVKKRNFEAAEMVLSRIGFQEPKEELKYQIEDIWGSPHLKYFSDDLDESSRESSNDDSSSHASSVRSLGSLKMRVRDLSEASHGPFSNDLDEKNGKSTIQSLIKYRKALLIALGCAVGQNLTLANGVLYYSVQIMKNAGLEDYYLVGIGIASFKFIGVICSFFLVEKIGRKKLLFFGSVGMAFSHFVMGLSFWLIEDTPSWRSGKILLQCSLFVFMFCWNLSWAGLMFVVASEILPSSIRGIGMSMVVSVFWVLAFCGNFGMGKGFDVIGFQIMFYISGALSILAAVFVWAVIPETAGQTLEEISKMMSGRAHAQELQ
eukprot:GDKJ01019798.1.p1 GENE.GDKJ01019798.1~~GDKJ01019798.1.p1  ORF type:complete len:534 (+),score=70.84 GDKJ01019798.1:83-1603(+)